MDRKRSKGRKLGSSRRLVLKENNPDDDQQPETGTQPDTDDPIFKDIKEKIQSLFKEEDDSTSNIFISRNDMQKVSNIVFLGVEELELLFDELNTEDKGYLTYDTFTSGLKKLIDTGSSQWDQKRKRKSTKRLSEFPRVPSMEETEFPRDPSLEESDTKERKQFKSFMEHLGAKNIFEDETEIWKLWTKLSHEEPRLLENLEEFLAKVTSQIKQARTEKETLEIMLKKRIAEHNEEVQRLYEEMEQQMHEEIRRLTHESDARSSVHNKEMKNVIDLKNNEVQQLVSVQDELEQKLHKLLNTEQHTKSENEKLKRANQDLEHDLGKIRGQLSEAQECLQEMREKMIQAEKESLATDEEDVPLNISNAQFYQIFFQDSAQKDQNKEAKREATVPLDSTQSVRNVTNYTDDFKTSRSRVISIEEDPIPECMLKDHTLLEDCIKEETTTHGFTSIQLQQKGQHFSLASEDSSHLCSLTEKKSAPLSLYSEIKSPDLSGKDQEDALQKKTVSKQDLLKGELSKHTEHGKIDKVIHSLPITDDVNQQKNKSSTPKKQGNPDHVYKIMFVGNSNVGKTSFLQRVHEGFCSKNVSATLGVDYRIKTLTIDDKQYLLQLWDTAGQERFHSITEHFFRKADGVVIMYDVTCNKTFKAVRYWLNLIQEKAVDDIVILLTGNKMDCDSERKVTYEDGKNLAQMYQLLFTECSAVSGMNVMESLGQIVRSLKEHEDNIKNNVIKINRQARDKEKTCCM